MTALRLADTGNSGGDDPLFAMIAGQLRERGYCLIPNALPEQLADVLFRQLQAEGSESFEAAGVGRDTDHTLNQFVRRDSIRWISGHTQAERDWLAWAERLRQALNRHLFLGLYSFETHFAHYAPGDFYRKHVDAFKAPALSRRSNRILSVVTYLNPGWLPDDGGELLIYGAEGTEPLLRVTPAYGSLVLFLSEEVPHEVLPARRDRYSVAGWFRSQELR